MTPSLRLAANVHPMSIPVEITERVVTVGVDVIAPGEGEGVTSRPLNLALVIDKSGSMQGDKIDTAKAAAVRVVERLSDSDTFTLVTFSTEAQVLIPAVRVGGQRAAIIERIRKLQPEAKTYLAGALRAALDQMRPHVQEGVSSCLYVLTDGEVHDADECLKVAPEALRLGIGLRSGGIGKEYRQDFLDLLSADPLEKGKYLVEHIDLEALASMATKFEEFISRKGHVVTANCRLSIEVPPRRVRVLGATAVEHVRPMPLDAALSTPIADLPVGGKSSHTFELSILPGVEGILRIATFRLRYDLPTSGLAQATAEAFASIEITRDPGKAMKRGPVVYEMLQRIQTTRLAEAAEKCLKANDVKGATKQLERVTRVLRDTGRLVEAQEVEDRRLAIERSNSDEIDLELKRLRGTTGRLSQ